MIMTRTHRFVFVFALILAGFVFLSPSVAWAVCSNPAGVEGEMIYNDDYDVLQFCDGSNVWVRVGASSTVDNRIGTLTNGKWCSTDGTTISCTQDAPGGATPAGTDGQIQFNASSALAADAALHWDNTNKRLGIGTSTPSYKLHVKGASGTTFAAIDGPAGQNTQLLFADNGTAKWQAGYIAATGNFSVYDVANTLTPLAIKPATPTGTLVLTSTGVGMGTASPAATALLDLTSTSQGFLPPRMDTTQRNTIASPATGLTIYNTTSGGIEVYNGSSWVSMNAAEVSFSAKGSSTSVANGTWVDIVYPTQLSEIGGDNYNAATGKFTAPSSGTYFFAATAQFSSQISVGQWGIIVQTAHASTGGTWACYQMNAKASGGGNYASVACSGSIYLTAGTQVEATAYQDSGGSQTLSTAGTFSGFKVGSGGSGGGSATAAGASGSIQFNDGANAFAADATNLVWDDTNNRLGIGTATPVASAALDVTSTTMGLLPPRMTSAQRNAIASAAAGLMIFNTDTAQMEFWNGTAWQGIGSMTTGTIAAFAASSCPTGWTEYTPARGRFLRGIDSTGTNDPDGVRAAGSTQDDAFQDHDHTAEIYSGTPTSGGNWQFATGAFTTSNSANYDPYPSDPAIKRASYNGPSGAGQNRGYRTATETRSKNVAVIFCQYSGSGGGGGGGSTTLAGLTDVDLSALADGKVLTYNNTAGKWEAGDAGGIAAGSVAGAVQFNDGSDAFAADDANLVWDDTNNRLGIGTATPSTELEVTGTIKASGPLWSAFGDTGTYRNLLLENFDDSANTNGVDMGVKLGGTEFQGLSWVQETAWTSASAASAKDAMLQFGVLNDNTPAIPMVIKANGSVGIGTASPNALLHVKGGTLIEGGTNSAALRLKRTNALSGSGHLGLIDFLDSSDVYGPRILAADTSLTDGASADLYFELPQGTPRMTILNSGSVGIGATSPAATALLDLTSTSKGFLPPRMDTTQRNTIASPATGLTIYNTTTNQLELYNGSGWTGMGGGTPVAFFANRTAGTTASGNVMVFNNETLDSGSNYNNATGVFTAPEAGVYHFVWGGIGNNANDYYRFYLRVNGVNTSPMILTDTSATGSEYGSGSASRYITLAQNDTVSVYYSADSGTVDYGNGYAYFGGSKMTAGGSGGGSATAAGSAGSLQFNDGANAFAADTTNLVWDDTNNRLGIGTATPAADLHVTGNDAFATNLILENTDTGGRKWTLKTTGSSGTGGAGVFKIDDTTATSTRFLIDTSGNVGIGTATPAATALLDLTSTAKGFLPPRMTTTQRNTITSPATGLTIYNTTSGGLEVYDGSVWVSMIGAEVSFRGENANASTAGSNVWTEVGSFTQTFDTGGDNFNPTTGKFTVPSSGLYMFSANLSFVITSSRVGVLIQKEDAGSNGTRVCAQIQPNSATGGSHASCSGVLKLNTGDVVEMIVYQESGSTTNIYAQFSGFKIQSGGSGGGGGSATAAGTTGSLQFNDGSNAFAADATNLVWDDTNNRLGIGTATPDVPMVVSANTTSPVARFENAGNATSRIRVQNSNAVSTSNLSGLDFTVMSSVQERISGQINSGFIDTTDATRTGYIDLGLFNSGVFGTVMRLQGDRVGVGTSSPASTALLDLTSTSKGFLPPRMTTTQRNTISSPATGLTIYNTTTGALEVYNGTSWIGAASSEISFHAYGATTSVPSGTWTTIVNPSELYDNGGNNYNPSTGLFTAPSTGVYFFSAISYGTNSATFGIEITRVADSQRVCYTLFAVTASGGVANCAGSINLTAGQTVQLKVYQNTGSTATLVANHNNFTGFKIGSGSGGGSATAAGSSGSIQFNDGANAFAADSTNLVWDNTNKRLGVGTSTPDLGITYASQVRLLTVAGDGTDSAVATGILSLANNRTTPAVDDVLGSLDFVSANNGASTRKLGARIQGYLEGSGGANGFGGNLRFMTKPDNGTAPSERMRIDSTGTVAIGTTTPAATALLDLTSTSKGFLPPRMDTTQRDAIASPAEGLVVYNTTTKSLDLRLASSWISFGGAQTGNSMVSGWPDAIKCTDAYGAATRVLYLSGVNHGGNNIYVDTIYNGADVFISYNATTGAYVTKGAAVGTTGNCYNVNISSVISGGNGYFFVGGSTASAAGSAGQIQFNEGGNLQADAALHWDNTNKRLGIGTATPASPLYVVGKAYLENATTAAENVWANPSLTARDSRAYALSAGGGITFEGKYNAAGAYSTYGWVRGFKETATDGDIQGGLMLATRSGSMIFKTQTATGTLDDLSTGLSMMITDTGNVGIGTTSPNVKLDVVGAIVSRVNNAGSATSVDFATSNVAYTSASCGAMTLSNMQDGGSYTLVVKGTTSGTCAFTHTGLTFKYPTGHGATTSGKHTVYTFIRAGTDVYVSWIPGY